MRNNLRDAVGRAGSKVARAKLNLAAAEAELSAATQAALAEPRLVRPPGQTLHSVKLLAVGGNKIGAIKAVRQFTHLGLKEAKDLVDSCVPFGHTPFIVQNMPLDICEQIRREIESTGGRAEIVRSRQR
jgi:large subunit ribosomal protein L7/L12